MMVFLLKIKRRWIGSIAVSAMLLAGAGCAGNSVHPDSDSRQVHYSEAPAAPDGDVAAGSVRAETLDHKVAQSQDPSPVVSGIADAAKVVVKSVLLTAFVLFGLVVTAI